MDYSRDRLWCLLVLSLDAQSDKLGCPLMGTWTLRCACVALHDSHPTWFTRNDFRAMSFMHVVRGSIICLIMLMLLRVATSESIIPRPCFPPLLYCFLSVLLLVCLQPFLLQIYKPCFTTHITHILASLRWTSAPIQLTIVLGVLRTQENHPVNYATIFWHPFCY